MRIRTILLVLVLVVAAGSGVMAVGEIVSSSPVSAANSAPRSWTQVVTMDDRQYTVNLDRVSFRGPEFEGVVQTGSKSFRQMDEGEVRTYVGTVEGHPDAVAVGYRYDDDAFELVVLFSDGEYNHSTDKWETGASWYQWNGTRMRKGIGAATPFEYSAPLYTVKPEQLTDGAYAFDVGVDVSRQYFRDTGKADPATALAKVEFNFAAGAVTYQRDAKLNPRIGRVVMHDSSSGDPYSYSAVNYLDDVIETWTEDHSDSQWDMVVGVAESLNMGLAKREASVVFSDNDGYFHAVWRHEMGHSWFLGHHDGSFAAGAGPEGGTINSNNFQARFSGAEVYRMLVRRDDRIRGFDRVSLTRQGNQNQPQLPPYAALDKVSFRLGTDNNLTIDLTANDFDYNGDSISVIEVDSQGREGGRITQRGNNAIYTPTSGFKGTDFFNYRIRDKAGQEAVGTVAVTVEAGGSLRLHLKLDDSSGKVATDSSPYGMDGELNRMSLPSNSTAGKLGKAMKFDGSSEHIAISDSGAAGSSVTFSAWINPDEAQDNVQTGIVFTPSPRRCGLSIGPSRTLQFSWDTLNLYNSSIKIPDQQWTFVALAVELNKATLYAYDGSRFQSEVFEGTFIDCNLSTIRVGAAERDDQKRRFDGLIDDARLYVRTLSQQDLQTVANGGHVGEPSARPSKPSPQQPAPAQPAPEQPAPEQPAPQQPAPQQPAPQQPAPGPSTPQPPSIPKPSTPGPSQPTPGPAPSPEGGSTTIDRESPGFGQNALTRSKIRRKKPVAELANSLDLSGVSSVEVEFSFTARWLKLGEPFFVEYSNDGGRTWTELRRFTRGANFRNRIRYQPSLTVDSSDVEFSANSSFRFRLPSDRLGRLGHVYIHDVSISPAGVSLPVASS